MKIKKFVHKGYTEWLNAKRQGINLRCHFGKYHYVYESEKGIISLIKLRKYDYASSRDVWEIFELSNNNLVKDIERFYTKEEAEERIKQLL